MTRPRLLHISQRERIDQARIVDTQTRCGHVVLNLDCITPDDYQRGLVPESEVCFHCRVTDELHRRKSVD